MVRFLLCSVVAVLVPSARRPRADDAEDKAAALVQKLGGTVVRDEKRSGQPVVEVDLSKSKVTGENLRALAPLQNLTALYLSHTPVTNADLKELAPFQKLRTLDLAYTPVTDDGLSGTGPAPEPCHTRLGQHESDGCRVEALGPAGAPHPPRSA